MRSVHIYCHQQFFRLVKRWVSNSFFVPNVYNISNTSIIKLSNSYFKLLRSFRKISNNRLLLVEVSILQYNHQRTGSVFKNSSSMNDLKRFLTITKPSRNR